MACNNSFILTKFDIDLVLLDLSNVCLTIASFFIDPLLVPRVVREGTDKNSFFLFNFTNRPPELKIVNLNIFQASK